ncbi:MAG: DUF2281 domain-containing protein [Gammaproteobacteria bacterium]|nr:DUF2281 domain-containing protein [Gammaproteobacteria bacterium]
MTKPEIEQRILQQSSQLPAEMLLEVLNFMEFLAAKKGWQRPFQEDDDWKQDFLSISQWAVTEQDVAIRSWNIEPL